MMKHHHYPKYAIGRKFKYDLEFASVLFIATVAIAYIMGW